MQKLVTYGLLTSLCALLTPACADSDGERPGATAGTGGTGGTGGASGGTGGAPAGGTGGGGGTGGAAPAGPPVCTGGCVELTVVTTAAGQQAQYLFRQGTTTYDMSNANVTWRVRLANPSAVPGDQIFVTPFAQNGETPDNYAGVFRPQTVLSVANGFTGDAWVDVTLELANTAPYGEMVTPPPPAGGGADAGAADAGDAGGAEEPTGPVVLDNNGGTFNKALVFQYGIQVGTLATATAFGTIRVAIDSVTYRTADGQPIPELPDQTFTTALEGLQLDNYMTPVGTQNPLFRP